MSTITEADTITEAAIAAVDASVIAGSPRPAMIGELARAGEAERVARERAAQLQARVDELTREISRLRDEQITDGGDPRLVTFWGKAEEVADEKEFCEEYDKIAEALGGPARMRSYSVMIDAKVDVRLYVSVTARSAEEAEGDAEDEIDSELIIEALRERGYDEIDVYNTEASE